MSGSLESLQNPLERLSVLPTTMSWRSNPVTNDPTWDVSLQYFYNDVVVSGVNGGAYIFTGGASTLGPPVVDHLWSLRGGVDPALDTNGYWQKMTQTGVETSVVATPTFAITAGPPSTFVVTNGALNDVPAGSVWLATLSYSVTWTAAQTPVDILTFQIASNGTGGSTDIEDVAPLVGATSKRGSAQFVVSAGANPPAQINLALSVNADAASQVVTALTGTLVWLRLE